MNRKNYILKIIVLLFLGSLTLNIYFSSTVKTVGVKSNHERLRSDSILSSKLHLEKNYEMLKKQLEKCAGAEAQLN
jgi:hypothetical protein